jgi:hypothetical protein
MPAFPGWQVNSRGRVGYSLPLFYNVIKEYAGFSRLAGIRREDVQVFPQKRGGDAKQRPLPNFMSVFME